MPTYKRRRKLGPGEGEPRRPSISLGFLAGATPGSDAGIIPTVQERAFDPQLVDLSIATDPSISDYFKQPLDTQRGMGPINFKELTPIGEEPPPIINAEELERNNRNVSLPQYPNSVVTPPTTPGPIPPTPPVFQYSPFDSSSNGAINAKSASLTPAPVAAAANTVAANPYLNDPLYGINAGPSPTAPGIPIVPRVPNPGLWANILTQGQAGLSAQSFNQQAGLAEFEARNKMMSDVKNNNFQRELAGLQFGYSKDLLDIQNSNTTEQEKSRAENSLGEIYARGASDVLGRYGIVPNSRSASLFGGYQENLLGSPVGEELVRNASEAQLKRAAEIPYDPGIVYGQPAGGFLGFTPPQPASTILNMETGQQEATSAQPPRIMRYDPQTGEPILIIPKGVQTSTSTTSGATNAAEEPLVNPPDERLTPEYYQRQVQAVQSEKEVKRITTRMKELDRLLKTGQETVNLSLYVASVPTTTAKKLTPEEAIKYAEEYKKLYNQLLKFQPQ